MLLGFARAEGIDSSGEFEERPAAERRDFLSLMLESNGHDRFLWPPGVVRMASIGRNAFRYAQAR